MGRAVALWDIDKAGVEATARDIAARYGVATLGLAVDLRDVAAIGPAAEASRAAIGPVGGLVHSAGTAGITGIAGVTPENFDSGMALHVRPIVLMVQAFRQDLATAWAIASGQVSAQRAFMAGRLRVGGDLNAMVAHREVFATLDGVLSPVRAQTEPPDGLDAGEIGDA